VALDEYKRKRDFSRTPEPAGRARAGRPGFSFVVQKHAASRLHYDFRLELDGVLKSWAVPKGPSLDPAEKRLAMETEDHPLDYAAFEGVIPEDQYGGGTVLVWDSGTWEPVSEDPRDAYAKGRLKFRLHGEKLRGGWMLVRIKGRDRRDRGKTWLLVKERDGEARPASEYDVTAARPESVKSGRGLEEVARERDRVWNSRAGERATPAHAGARSPRVSTGVTVAGVRLTHPDRVLYPDEGITKRELAELYADIAEWILPHLRGRPTMYRARSAPSAGGTGAMALDWRRCGVELVVEE